ncbi:MULTISPECIES: hypothetical protein [unclassified Lysinibacillus]|uniref:hypothetical protein n=1 Tax=unclassified Lysinibacillus TaxID=2636778 RepID=UPI00381FBEE5
MTMILGLKMHEVKIVPYDNEWKNEFIRVRSEIIEHTNIQCDRIQHIGRSHRTPPGSFARKRSVSDNVLSCAKAKRQQQSAQSEQKLTPSYGDKSKKFRKYKKYFLFL